jgi:hypothetical protein
MDASDWTRIKKLNGARGNMYVVHGPVSPAPPPLLTGITNPAPRLETESGRRVYTEFGTSKIRRPASNYTDFRASQTADYVLESVHPTNKVGKKLDHNWVCDCDKTSIDVLKGSNGICLKCRT